MEFRQNIPGIQRHNFSSMTSNEAITIEATGHESVQNPISSSINYPNFQHISSDRMQNALALAQIDIQKMKAASLHVNTSNNLLPNNQIIRDSAFNAALIPQIYIQTPDTETARPKSAQKPAESKIRAQWSKTVNTTTISRLSNELAQVIKKFPSVKHKVKIFTKDHISTDSGLAERKKTLVRLLERSKQVNRLFYSLKQIIQNRPDIGKILTQSVSLIKLYHQALPDIVMLTHCQSDRKLVFDKLEQTLLPVLPIIEHVELLNKMAGDAVFDTVLVDMVDHLEEIDDLTLKTFGKYRKGKKLDDTFRLLGKMKKIGEGKKELLREARRSLSPSKKSKLNVQDSKTIQDSRTKQDSRINQNSRTYQNYQDFENRSDLSFHAELNEVGPKRSSKLIVKKTAAQRSREQLNSRKISRKSLISKKSSDSGFQTNKSSKTRFNTETDDSAVEIAASDIAAAIFETRKSQKSKESNIGLYEVQSGIPVRISSEKIIDHSREFITTTDDFAKDFNVKQARNDLLAQIDADLLTIYNQIQEIDERYTLEKEEKQIINKISETVTSRISSVHVNPTINSEVLHNLSVAEDEFEVKLQKGITIKPETVEVKTKPKPEYLSLNLDSCDRIDKYKSEMLDFQRASRFKRQQTARLQVLGKNINHHEPDPFVTFDLAGEQVLNDLVGFSVDKFEEFLEQLTTDLWNEEFAAYEIDDETLVEDETVNEITIGDNSPIPSKNFTALLKHSISIEETIEHLENTLKLEDSPIIKQKSDFSKKISQHKKILEISIEEEDDETMNETDIASFSMSPKEESNELGPMNSTFRTPTASSRPSVFQANSRREITNSNGTSNSLQMVCKLVLNINYSFFGGYKPDLTPAV